MTNDEHTLLNHYNITNLYPTTWPSEKDESDASGDEKPTITTAELAHQRSKSRYSALARSTSDRRSLVPGTERTGDGIENLVQKDEPDPLGGPDSVVRILRHRGLPVEEDQRLRNRFLLSSTTFSPTLYLSQVHSNASTQSLLQGLEFLSKSIDQKSASLKVLVESNFERFVRAKTTIDNVYAEMRNQGAEAPPTPQPRTHSRITSKGSAHFRKSSAQGGLSPRGFDKPLPSDKKKHALSKESEYGVQGIKAPLVEVAVKAEEIWGPALGGREREEALRSAMTCVEKSSDIIQVDGAIARCIKNKDYDGLIEEFRKAKRFTEAVAGAAKAHAASNNRGSLTDSQMYQIVITGRMWSGVQVQMDDFKRDVWRRLSSVEDPPLSSETSGADESMTLIKVLLELGVDDNPIWVWLLNTYEYLRNKITASFERSRVEVEILRRRLANAEPPSSTSIRHHLKGPGDSAPHGASQQLDTSPIIELWELVHSSISHLLSPSSGLVGEVLEFWEKAQSFIDGTAQKLLPIGIDGQSQKYHRLSTDGVRILQKGVVELVENLRESVFAFFADPPIDDVSMLYSPLPPTTPNTPKSAAFAPWAHQDSRFRLDANNPPPPSHKRDEAWEAFAFWPPYANALSGIHYLEKLLTLVGAGATELAGLRPVASSSTTQESLKVLVGGTRERCINALLAAWTRDVGLFKSVEVWDRPNDRTDLTKMPMYFLAFESAVLSGLQKLAYIPNVASKGISAIVITAPSSAMLKPVRRAFERSLYILLSEMVKMAMEKESAMEDLSSLHSAPFGLTSKQGLTGKGQVENRPIRLLLTMSNIKFFQAELVPQLITTFETNFSTRLTDESKTIKDVLIQIDEKLFGTYTKNIAEHLSSIIQTGITSPTWVPTTDRPTELRPYIYEALLVLVAIHTEILTTAPSLLHPIISDLFEQMLQAFLSGFRTRTDRYSLAALMQATLDVEFVASILSQYTSPKASELQTQVYQELDQRTDNSARTKLQNELPEMRAILKRLREGTRGEFACFKKQRTKA
ncbi:MAG: hypothetical protein L6R37_004494 [Teloschistes peruensis]|nr:MAG: hypothetical protein L6R37_004494 [Teloschistes peruensis]